jgi:hypothetical protein
MFFLSCKSVKLEYSYLNVLVQKGTNSTDVSADVIAKAIVSMEVMSLNTAYKFN